MKLALGLDVQTNAKGGKFMSIEDSHQGALVCKVDVEVLCNFQDDGAKRVGVCFATNTASSSSELVAREAPTYRWQQREVAGL